ncbi:MAG: SusC/RagA family TonB-linked outer membrane protein, partial [Bacteroidota bacterium]
GINQNYVLGAYQSVPYISPDEYVDGETLLAPLLFRNTPLFLIDKLNTFLRRDKEVKAIGSFEVSYEIMDGLTARVQGGADFTDQKFVSSQTPDSFTQLIFGLTGFQAQSSTQSLNYNALANLSYTKEIDKHSFTVGAYTEVIRGFYDQFGFTARGINLKTFTEGGDGAGFIDDSSADDLNVDDGFATRREAGLFSYFFSGDYDYDTRFGFGTTLRRDASYRFAETNRWGTFYSFSGRWNLHREAFMDNISAINVLKLRASYGKTGNQRIVAVAGQFAPFIAGFNFLDLYGTGQGYGGINAINVSQLGESDLRWEEIIQTNIGVDVEAFESRLRTNVDVYVKRTNGGYDGAPISPLTGFFTLDRNIVKLENRGIDWTVAYDVLREEVDGIGLTFQVVGNYNKQEIIDLPQENGEQIDNAIFGIREGGILSEAFVYRYAGVNPENGNALFFTADGETTENPDVVNDRVWTNKNIFPDVQGSFSVNLDYKGFFLQSQWNYVLGVDRFDFDYLGFVDPTAIGQFRHSRDLLDAWTPENTGGSLPSLDATNQALISNSDFSLLNSDYLRLRFISLGYNLPKSILEPAKLTSASIFVNAENLVTFSEWRGNDAESAFSSGANLYPTPRIISFGLEVGF